MSTPRTASSINPGLDSPAPGDRARLRTDQVASVLVAPVALAQRVLPTNLLPVALGTGALLLAGVVEWPVVRTGTGLPGGAQLAHSSLTTHPWPPDIAIGRWRRGIR